MGIAIDIDIGAGDGDDDLTGDAIGDGDGERIGDGDGSRLDGPVVGMLRTKPREGLLAAAGGEDGISFLGGSLLLLLVLMNVLLMFMFMLMLMLLLLLLPVTGVAAADFAPHPEQNLAPASNGVLQDEQFKNSTADGADSV